MVPLRFLNLIALVLIKLLSLSERLPLPLILRLNALVTKNGLITEINQLRDCLHKVEHIRDCLNMELNLERRMAGVAMSTVGRPPRSHKHYPDLECVRGKVRSTVRYPEGGSYTTWITDGSSASNFDDNKENMIPAFLSSPTTDITDHSTAKSSSSHNSALGPEPSWEV
ncbi:hypothetical protein L208DRAFT_1376756 [Tricholoma matsutake]|nr:hypothetical protein L208DRAFT_1376756 [Tricholoma matsutake 945]